MFVLRVGRNLSTHRKPLVRLAADHAMRRRT